MWTSGSHQPDMADFSYLLHIHTVGISLWIPTFCALTLVVEDKGTTRV